MLSARALTRRAAPRDQRRQRRAKGVLSCKRAAGALALAAALAMAHAAAPPTADAQTQEPAADAPIALELNKLEPREAACQAFLVMTNGEAKAFESLKLDLVAFDLDGVIIRRLAVEMGPLPADKTIVKSFPIDAVQCDGVGRVLLNGLLACRDESGDREGCVDLIATRSRDAPPFVK